LERTLCLGGNAIVGFVVRIKPAIGLAGRNQFGARCIKKKNRRLQFLGFIDFKPQLDEAMRFDLFQHLPAGIDMNR